MQHVRKIYVPARAQLPDSSGFLIKGQYQVRGGKKEKKHKDDMRGRQQRREILGANPA